MRGKILTIENLNALYYLVKIIWLVLPLLEAILESVLKPSSVIGSQIASNAAFDIISHIVANINPNIALTLLLELPLCYCHYHIAPNNIGNIVQLEV